MLYLRRLQPQYLVAIRRCPQWVKGRRLFTTTHYMPNWYPVTPTQYSNRHAVSQRPIIPTGMQYHSGILYQQVCSITAAYYTNRYAVSQRRIVAILEGMGPQGTVCLCGSSSFHLLISHQCLLEARIIPAPTHLLSTSVSEHADGERRGAWPPMA